MPPERPQIEARNRSNHIRLDSGKRNMAPSEDAKWWRLVSVQLANGDNVQAIETWKFPKALDGVKVGDVDYFVQKIRTHRYRADSRSDDWLGLELAAYYNRDVHNRGDILWIQETIGKWLKAGNFKKEQCRDEKRKLRTFFVPMDEPDTIEDESEEEK